MEPQHILQPKPQQDMNEPQYMDPKLHFLDQPQINMEPTDINMLHPHGNSRFPSTPSTITLSDEPDQEAQLKSVNVDENTQSPPVLSPISMQKLPLSERLRHFTWAWYTLTMSTGGLALLLAAQPFKFNGLPQIGLAVYILDLVLFIMNCSLMTARFVYYDGFTGLINSIKHAREGFFFPTFWLSLATIISGMYRYFGSNNALNLYKDGGAPSKGFLIFLEILFWLYCACTFSVAVFQYGFVFNSIPYPLQTMMPSWILPAFPVMLSGTIASVISESEPSRASIPIAMAGTTFQGLGFSISIFMYAHYIGRLMESGIPNSEHRPGMFICVGPPAFTCLAIIGMAQGLPENLSFGSSTFLIDASNENKNLIFSDKHIVELIAIMAGAFLWALSFWFFSLATYSVFRSPPKAFHLNWWAMVFPNTGFTIATITLGKSLKSDGVKGVGAGMSVLIVCMWLFVAFNHLRAVLNKSIMWPGKDEDINE